VTASPESVVILPAGLLDEIADNLMKMQDRVEHVDGCSEMLSSAGTTSCDKCMLRTVSSAIRIAIIKYSADFGDDVRHN